MKIKMGFREGANGTTSDHNYWAKMKGRQQEVMVTGTSSCLHQLEGSWNSCTFAFSIPHFPVQPLLRYSRQQSTLWSQLLKTFTSQKLLPERKYLTVQLPTRSIKEKHWRLNEPFFTFSEILVFHFEILNFFFNLEKKKLLWTPPPVHHPL